MMDPHFEWRTREEKNEVIRYWWRKQKAICHLCGERMEPYSQAAISPWAATIEHLKPRRENGPNTVGNTRLAHRYCNNAIGALWEQNRQREAAGLPPMPEHWALSNAAGRLRAKESIVHARRILPKAVRGSMAAMIEKGEHPRPRGATLDVKHDPLVKATLAAFPGAKIVEVKPPLVAALETARRLREEHERRGKVWRLA